MDEKTVGVGEVRGERGIVKDRTLVELNRKVIIKECGKKNCGTGSAGMSELRRVNRRK